MTEKVGQRPEGDDGRDEDRGLGYEPNGPASSSSCTNDQVENRYSFDVELDIINVYASLSGDSGSRASTRPISLNSQIGCALVNEDEYIVENEFDCEEDDWDECEMSSSEE